MIKFYTEEYRPKVKRLLGLLLPVIATELAMFGMNFFDACMSGQAGAVELAGTAMAGNFWMPLRAGFGGGLMAGAPIIAQLIGAQKKEDIPHVVQQGFFLAFAFAVLVLAFFIFGVDFFYDYLNLEPGVRHVAYWYGISVGAGVLPFFLVGPLRALIDSLGHTDLSMKIFLMALPINVVLNYIFIFGFGPVPAYGGIGAGIATGITYWIIFLFYAFSVYYLPGIREYGVFKNISFNASAFWEYLRIGVPLGCGIFLECGCFAMTAFLIAKFGTAYIAADMAATNFCTIMYMIPCSISMGTTILVGIEVGARRYREAHVFSVLALQISLAAVFVYTFIEFFNRDLIAMIYTKEAEVAGLIIEFMFLGIIWQFFDAVGSPLQGILRGYKDVKVPTIISIISFWGICIPYGVFMDYYMHRSALCYWEGINICLLFNSIVLYCRYKYLEQKYKSLDGYNYQM